MSTQNNSSSDVLKQLEQYSMANWMENLLRFIPAFGSKQLYEVALPGTHDSGCYTSTFTLYGRAQDQNIKEQLEGGIRYFDLRFCSVTKNDTNEFYIKHGVIDGEGFLKSNVKLENILTDLKEFLTQYSSELIILHLTHFKDLDSADVCSDFFDRIFNELSSYLIPNSTSTQLSNLLEAGSVILSVDTRDRGDNQIDISNLSQNQKSYLWDSIPSPYDEPIYQTGDPNMVKAFIESQFDSYQDGFG